MSPRETEVPAAATVSPKAAFWLGLLPIVVVALLLRGLPVLAHDWPLRDGGFFWQLIADLRANGFALPDTTTYNGAGIPYAYPPLAFYLAAALEAGLGADRAVVLRALVITASTLAVPAVAMLARELLSRPRHALFAAAAYAAIPGSYLVHVTGGGLPRSIGFLLALLATWQGLRAFRTGSGRSAMATAVLAGMAVATHPQSAVFVAVALAVGLIARRSRRALVFAVGAACGAAFVASPWWLTVLLRHGPDPMLHALAVPYRDAAASVIAYGFLVLAAAPILGALDIVGQVHQLRRRRFHLPTWRVGVFLLDLRYSPVAAAVPASLLAAVGLVDVGGQALGAARHRFGRSVADGGALALGAALTVGALAPAVALSMSLAGLSGALSAPDRSAMDWVRTATAPGTRFVVLAGDAWGSDDIAEWFPALAGRDSLVTSQGLEWTGGNAAQLEREEELRACAPASVACIRAWIARHGDPSRDGIYVAVAGSSAVTDRCCAALAAALRATPGYRIAYEGPGALVVLPVPLRARHRWTATLLGAGSLAGRRAWRDRAHRTEDPASGYGTAPEHR